MFRQRVSTDPPTVLFSTSAGYVSDANSTSTPSETTPANASFFVFVTWQDDSAIPFITDNKGNIYSQIFATATPSGGIVSEFHACFRCENGTGGANHVFTANKTGGFTSIYVAATEPTAIMVSGTFTNQGNTTTASSPTPNVTKASLLLGGLGYESSPNAITIHSPVSCTILRGIVDPSQWQGALTTSTVLQAQTPLFVQHTINVTGGPQIGSGSFFLTVWQFP